MENNYVSKGWTGEGVIEKLSRLCRYCYEDTEIVAQKNITYVTEPYFNVQYYKLGLADVPFIYCCC